jgi:thiosulfate dehydrogenase
LRGRAILLATRDSLPHNVGNNLRCVSCHLDSGTRAYAMPWVGVYSRFPQYRARSGSVNRLEDRINDCFQRSLNGHALPFESTEMRDIVAYMAYLSHGVAPGQTLMGQGILKMEPLPTDSSHGAKLFGSTCARCHGDKGTGAKFVDARSGDSLYAPPVWGSRSYNIGAGMARVRTTAAFIRNNMPYDKPNSLTDQDAFDIAYYLDHQPRPDFKGKEHDWPEGDAPPDVAYPTLARKKSN